jgi:dTDP-4-dehydrorhamnose reductase
MGIHMNRKAVVFGCAGQLGVELVGELKARGYNVAAWDRSEVDIADAVRVENRVAVEEPDVVFNAAAYNQVDVAEKEPQAAFQVNALAVRNLALACRQTGARLVHFSTDYVFDGLAHHPYAEDDPTHPLSAYAVSKLAGELYAQAYLDRVLVVRTSGVYGPGALRTARGNFIELMMRLVQSSGPVRVVEDHIGSPTYAPLLASRTIDLMERKLSGVFHIGGGTPICWFDFARLIFEVAGLEAPALQATNDREYRTAARRPKYSALSNGKIERLGLEPMPPLKEAVAEYFTARFRALATAPSKTA